MKLALIGGGSVRTYYFVESLIKFCERLNITENNGQEIYEGCASAAFNYIESRMNDQPIDIGSRRFMTSVRNTKHIFLVNLL